MKFSKKTKILYANLSCSTWGRRLCENLHTYDRKYLWQITALAAERALKRSGLIVPLDDMFHNSTIGKHVGLTLLSTCSIVVYMA
jgi:hypothetical protein